MARTFDQQSAVRQDWQSGILTGTARLCDCCKCYIQQIVPLGPPMGIRYHAVDIMDHVITVVSGAVLAWR